MPVDYHTSLLTNVHDGFSLPDTGETYLIQGKYGYWHYGCDGFNDKGWGCGYRTLQTVCSWILYSKNLNQKIPSIRTIQERLVDLEDKDKPFIGSKEWIGSFEACLILNNMYKVLCRIVHISRGSELEKHVDIIKKHFEDFGSPIMMGGDKDCSSKCIVGLHIGTKNSYLLIVDPHFVGRAKSAEQLQKSGWIKWQNLKDFIEISFYNLCMPLMKSN